MRHTRAAPADDLHRGAALHIDDGAPRPAWRILAWTVVGVMAFWAIGILDLPASDRRLVDWIGGLTVLAVLVGWVRANACSLAATEPQVDRDARVRVRLIRVRRLPLASIGGPRLDRSRRPRGPLPPS